MAGMQRRHFETIAATIKQEREAARLIYNDDVREGKEESLRAIVEGLASDLAVYNPQFDRARFVKACGF